jgi:two-component system, chemotaxis family, sensor histidine kinase and response regulator WspE
MSALDALFRDEVDRQASVLRDGLQRCERAAPDGEMLFATQALKGAARVVGIPSAERVSDALELLLGAAESSAMRLSSAQLQACADALELIEAIAQVGAARAEEVAAPAQVTELTSRLAASSMGPAPLRRPKPLASVPATTLDMFRQECEMHAATMGEGLLALERQPDQPALLDRLMRASHSIKGAARAVGLDAAVALAHAAEDQLERARHGQILASPELIDALLEASDLFHRIGAAAAKGLGGPSDEAIATCTARIVQAGVASAFVAAGDAAKPGAIAPDDVPAASTGSADPDRVVRIRATQLSRLVALSGELVVECSRLRTLASLQQRLRARQSDIADLLDDLQQSMAVMPVGRAARERVAQLQHGLNEWRADNAGWVDDFGQYARRTEDLGLRLYREALDSRMRPLGDGLSAFPRLVRDIAKRLGKQALLTVTGEAHRIDRDILERIEAPINHLLRNALDHGLERPSVRRENGKPEQGRVAIEARIVSGLLEIAISDDGAGVDLDKVRKRIVAMGLTSPEDAQQMPKERVLDHLFLSGFSTAEQVTELSGRGVGLAVVRSVMRDIGGSVNLQTQSGQGARFELLVPISRSVLHAVVVSIAGEPYAFALTRVERVVRLAANEIGKAANRHYMVVDEHTVSLVWTCELLELGLAEASARTLDVVVVNDFGHRMGFVVDAVLGEQDMVLQPLDARLGRVPDLSAAAILPDGRPVLVLDTEDMVRSVLHTPDIQPAGAADPARAAARKLRVLVADDTSTIREMERDLLTGIGYDVVTAADGMEAWHRLRESDFDLVVTDIDMPRLDGIGLIRSIRQDARLQRLPVVVVSYRASRDERQLGLDAGASAYLTKADYDDRNLIETVARLIGSP